MTDIMLTDASMDQITDEALRRKLCRKLTDNEFFAIKERCELEPIVDARENRFVTDHPDFGPIVLTLEDEGWFLFTVPDISPVRFIEGGH